MFPVSTIVTAISCETLAVVENIIIATIQPNTALFNILIGRFNFKGPDQQKRVGTLSGGERGRLHLAKTLISGGNVLLLDEPSNDLMSRHCVHLKMRYWNLPVVYWSSPMIAGFSTVLQRISSLLKVIHKSHFLPETILNMKLTNAHDLVKKAPNPSVSVTNRLLVKEDNASKWALANE